VECRRSASGPGGSDQIQDLRIFSALRGVDVALLTAAMLVPAKPSKDQQHYDSIAVERNLRAVAAGAEQRFPSVLHQFAFEMVVVTVSGVPEVAEHTIHCFAVPLDMYRCVLAATVAVVQTIAHWRQAEAAFVEVAAAVRTIQVAVSAAAVKIAMDTAAHKLQQIAAMPKAALAQVLPVRTSPSSAAAFAR